MNDIDRRYRSELNKIRLLSGGTQYDVMLMGPEKSARKKGPGGVRVKSSKKRESGESYFPLRLTPGGGGNSCLVTEDLRYQMKRDTSKSLRSSYQQNATTPLKSPAIDPRNIDFKSLSTDRKKRARSRNKAHSRENDKDVTAALLIKDITKQINNRPESSHLRSKGA